MRIRCHGNPFTEQLPSDSPSIVDVFPGRYQATHVPSRDRCIATTTYTNNSKYFADYVTTPSVTTVQILHYII
jgi:hypothetical protein